MDERLKEIIQMNDDKRDIAEFAGIGLSLNQYDYLIEQAKAYEKLCNNLQEFLQGRSTQFGEDVVDETIKYAKVIEHENSMLKKLTEELTLQLSATRKRQEKCIAALEGIENFVKSSKFEAFRDEEDEHLLEESK